MYYTRKCDMYKRKIQLDDMDIQYIHDEGNINETTAQDTFDKKRGHANPGECINIQGMTKRL